MLFPLPSILLSLSVFLCLCSAFVAAVPHVKPKQKISSTLNTACGRERERGEDVPALELVNGKWEVEIGIVDTRFNGCKQRKRCMPPLTCSTCSRAGKNNCQQTWKRDQRILRTISLYAATSAEQSTRRTSESTWESHSIEFSLHSLCAGVCVCVCRVVPYLLFSSPSCCYSAKGSPLFLPLSLMLTSNGVGKNPIRRRMCRVWRCKNHRSLFFHSFVCECVSFSFPLAGLRRTG